MTNKWKSEWQRLARVKDSVRLVWQASPRWMVVNVVVMVLQSIFPPLMLLILKRIIDAVGRHADFAVVLRWIVFAVIVAMFDAALRALGNVVSEAEAQVVSDRVNELLLAKSTQLELGFYENHRNHDAFHRAQTEGPQRLNHLVNALNQLVRTTATLLGILVLLFRFQPLFVLLVLAFAIPVVLVRGVYGRELQRWRERTTPQERKASYFHSLLTQIEPAKEIRLFGLGALFIKRFDDLRSTIRRERLAMAGRRAWVDIATQLLPEVAIFACLGFLAREALRGRVGFGGLVIYFWALQWGRSLLNETLAGLVNVYEDTLFLASLHDFLALDVQLVEPLEPVAVPHPLRSGISVKHLSFRYPNSDRFALEDVDLTIRAGEKVALVGENGSGKTTFVKLICRLYDPASGDIELDGISLRSFHTAALRREISVVFQDYMCYALSARENIWIGNPQQPPDDPAITVAAARTGIDEVIRRLPEGYETQLGKQFEGGTELSIGEWQKVALARAFMRDSQILILDEPTAALDAEAEYEVFQRFYELAEGRTAILISHRLSTVRMAERIFVFERGRIVESGTHDELMLRHGRYARLFTIQAQAYG